MGTENKTKINRLIRPVDDRHSQRHVLPRFIPVSVVTCSSNTRTAAGWNRLAGAPTYAPGTRWTGRAPFTRFRRNWAFPFMQAGRRPWSGKAMPTTCRRGKSRVFLYGPRGLALPAWFKGDRFGVEFVVTRTNLFPAELREGFTEFTEKDFSVRISAPELAMLEMLHLVPQKVGFDEARLVMGNLATLRPEVVQGLLEACRSVKVKRLFLYMAENQEHAWLSKVDLSKVDLGKGKRMIVPKGRYDAEISDHCSR